MAKKINFKYNDKEYTLEFTRNTISTLERQGFVPQDLLTKPMTMLPTLFRGSFLAHHPFVKQDVVDEIFSLMKDKQGLLNQLVEMYNEPIESLISEPNDDEKNVVWTATD